MKGEKQYKSRHGLLPKLNLETDMFDVTEKQSDKYKKMFRFCLLSMSNTEVVVQYLAVLILTVHWEEDLQYSAHLH